MAVGTVSYSRECCSLSQRGYSPLTSATTVRGTCRFCLKRESVSLHDLHSTGHHLLGVSFVTSLQSDLCATLTTQNTKYNNYIISHAQNTTALQLTVFLTGIHRLPFTSKGLSNLA